MAAEQRELLSNLYTWTVFVILFNVIEETHAQKGCSNPITKMYEEVQVLGVATSYNQTFVECKGILSTNCCNPKYYVHISTNFYDIKSTTLDFWLKYLKPKMYQFVDTYDSFLTWYSENEAKIMNNTERDADVRYFRSIVDNLEEQKKKCFVNLWKHTATMRCLVCDSEYKASFRMLRNRTIDMYLSEEMCQTIQKDCSDYAR